MAKDPELRAHLEWLGYVQPVGLVVSAPALAQAQAHINRNIIPEHRQLLECVEEVRLTDARDSVVAATDLPGLLQKVFGWEPADLIGGANNEATLDSLEVTLPEYNDRLRPTYAVKEWQPKDPARPWLLLILTVPTGIDLDEVGGQDDHRWQASPQARFERLLRETGVPIGLLSNATHLRLVYAPRGESSGYATFRVKDMTEVAGRPIFGALHMLIWHERLFSMPEKQRLPAILAESRKYQNLVSTQLAEQVLAALYELVRGFQAADDASHGQLLRDVLADDPNHVYAGLLTVLMRLVFVLYAEDRGLVSNDPVYVNHYSVTGLFDRLRTDMGRYSDTMNQRYGAWAQLPVLFRLIYDGGSHGGFHIPPRKGYLFDPDRYPFLEGRPRNSRRTPDERITVPRISDGVIFRVLSNLLILDGERLSYRTLDVEQIGSVYETIMGFNLEVAEGRSIAIKPAKAHGAPATINLEALIATKPADRGKWLAEHADQKLAGKAGDDLKAAATIDDLLAALDRKIAWHATPNIVPKAAMVLQPSDERRRSGSHYTPRSLTEPIVRTTLRPILERLTQTRSVSEGRGDSDEPSPESPSLALRASVPTPEQILDLKICDMAMGSGAFLVETCRQLGDVLVKAWHVHGRVPRVPPDEDELLHARRLIAQRCLYGVDKNPLAVDLAKLSLWLATLAKDHPFTFLDHSLRCGDSLVGLSREQIAAFHWQPPAKRSQDDVWFGDPIAERMRTVTEYRQRILAARDDKPYERLLQELDVADEALSLARLTGDCVIAAYFSAGKDRERVAKLDTLARQLVQYLGPQRRIEDRQPLTEAVASLHGGDHPLQPFHWQIEFPEVFTVDAKGKPTGGFDALVGNPPFLGGSKLSSSAGKTYMAWLAVTFEESHGKSDLVAFFFRKAFELLRSRGTFGLIATNTIRQGDTRQTGLRWIRRNGGSIYFADLRRTWPGVAAVVVSVVHVAKGSAAGLDVALNGLPVPEITAYLFHFGPDDNPSCLAANRSFVHSGTNINGKGFVVSPAERDVFVADDPRAAERLRPYLGAEEMNESPLATFCRYVIHMEGLSHEEVRRWPRLYDHLSSTVRQQRADSNELRLRENWWLFSRPARELYESCAGVERVLASGRAGGHINFVFQSPATIFSDSLTLFLFSDGVGFAVLQSRLHEVWARFFGSSLKDDNRYIPEDCFETFPFPAGVLEHAAGDSPTTDNRPLTTLETAGREYYEFRAALMVRHHEGLTKTYNRFHDRDHDASEPNQEIVGAIQKLRALHAAMDRAVLEAYGWHDLAQTATCEFPLDYEEEEEEEEGSGFRGQGSGRQRKKPWRYRWPDEFRDEVLARLLELNKQRAEEEKLSGAAAESKQQKSGRRKGKPKRDGPELIG